MPSKKRQLLITSGLPYSNGRLHVGHIGGAYLPADIFVRYARSRGHEVRFVCGSDDHGVAIMLAAEKEGLSPADTAKHYSQLQAQDFAALGIDFDIYGGTSRTPYHYKASQDFFLAIHRKGYFEKKSSRQFYDPKKNIFLPDRYVKGKCAFCQTPEQYGDQCENCGKMLDVESLLDAYSVHSGEKAIVKETVHWFLDLTRFEKEVSTWLDSAILRDTSRTYVKGLLASGLVKRAMTRDISWGIPVPLDDPDAKNKVLYVWFDAPIGYISDTMEACAKLEGSPEAYTKWWKSSETEIFHFIGEDNTVFHCVIWIAMLSAEGSLQLPKGVVVNQYINFQKSGQAEEKMSKSRGTAVWIGDYIQEGGNPDSLRYYLTSIAPERGRTAFNSDELRLKHNAELANTIGNFVHRILSFNHKHVGAMVPAYDSSKLGPFDQQFVSLAKETLEKTTLLLEEFSIKAALETIMDYARACNKYVDDKAPWTTRKTDMEATKVTLALAIDAIKFLSITLAPFIPFTSKKMAEMLQLGSDELDWDSAAAPLQAGRPLSEPSILFTKIE